MEASISFNVYKDFSKYIENSSEDNEWNYAKALKSLNTLIKKLIKDKELTITYKGKEVKILLPLKEEHIGNIFTKDDIDGAHWNDVQIPCKINCKEDTFKSDELQVDKHPYYFEPIIIYY